MIKIAILSLLIFVSVHFSSLTKSFNSEFTYSYDDFSVAGNSQDLEKLLIEKSKIYLSGGDYYLDNPIVIDQEKPLYIHGGDQIGTTIRGRNPAEPLFIVSRAPLISVSGLRLLGDNNADNQAFVFVNADHTRFELLDLFMDSAKLHIQGPGEFILQGVAIASRGEVDSPLVVDHDEADLLVVGGNMKLGGVKKPLVFGSDLYNVWQKKGRVRVFGVGVQWSLGRADFRVESESKFGPHVFAYIRSEGNNGKWKNASGSHLVYVPPTDNPVNIVMTANGGSWDPAFSGKSSFLDYNGAGNVWLIANSSPHGANVIVKGDAPKASVAALGNRVYGPPENALAVRARQVFNIKNIYSHASWSGDASNPKARFLPLARRQISSTNIPPVPRVEIPIAISRPDLASAFPGMIDVKRDFGAIGNGTADDTIALQNAFSSNKKIFIPEGTYRITKPIGFSHSKFQEAGLGEGGWISGAGRDKTIIRRDSKDLGSVFVTEGMGYITIQGITFETANYDDRLSETIDVANVELEYNPAFDRAFATQEVTFHNCRFKGGKYAVSVGMRTKHMGSENLFINSEFSDAKIGLAIGSYNALNNIAYQSTFINNDVTIGHDRSKLTGGTGALFNVKIRGTKKQEVAVHNTAGSPWYFNGIWSDSPRLFSAPQSGIPYHLIFERYYNSVLMKNGNIVDSASGGSLVFLHSNLTGGSIRLSSDMSVIPLFIIHSETNSISVDQIGENSREIRIY